MNTGTVVGLSRLSASGGAFGWAHCLPIGLRWGGAVVVLRSGRAGHMGKGGSGFEKNWRL